MDHQYDAIIIGTGDTGHETVQALNKQGKKAVFIELSPEMVATMVCHNPKKNPPSSNSLEVEQEPLQVNKKINLQTQTTHTPVGETITYTFHVTEVVADEPEMDVHTPPLSDHEHPKIQDVPDYQPFVEEPPQELTLIENMMQPNLDVKPILNEALSLYKQFEVASTENTEDMHYEMDDPFIEEIIEDDHDLIYTDLDEIEEIDTIEEVVEIDDDDTSSMEPQDKQREPVPPDVLGHHPLRPSFLSKQQERENSLREKLLIQRKEKSPFDTEQTQSPPPAWSFQEEPPLYEDPPQSEETKHEVEEENITPPSNEEKQTEDHKEVDHSSFLDSVLNKPVYSPRESRLRKRLKNTSKSRAIVSQSTIPIKTENPIETSQDSPSAESIPKEPPTPQPESENKVYTIEPFSIRRRARAQKKNRILSTVERVGYSSVENSNSTEPHPIIKKTQTESQLKPEQPLSINPEIQKEPQLKPETQEPKFSTDPFGITDQFNQSNELLKRDNIEFEEPYGYNSWEDIITTSSQNGRKRQEIDEVEKRKIALRGLHNLINNLG